MAETQVKTSSGLAIAGLVLGILAILGSFLPIINNLSFILALIGGVLSVVALIGAMRGKHTAKGMSIAGVVLAVVSIVVVLATQSMYSAAIDAASESLKDEPVAASKSSSDDSAKGEAAKSNDAGANAEAKQEEKQDAKQDEKQEEKQNEKAEETKEEEVDYSNMEQGQAVEMKSGLSVVVNSVQPGPTRYDDSPTVCVSVTYTNNGDSNESFNPYDWKSLDANGVESSTTYVANGVDELQSGKLQAGGTVTGNIYFEGEPVKILYYSNMFNDDASAGWNV